MKSVERRAWSVEEGIEAFLLSAKRYTLYATKERYPLNAIIVFLFLISALCSALHAADDPIERFLPSPGFSEGWVMEGKVKRFTADNLYMHINGEAELYIPFGFEVLGTALYAKAGNTDTALVVDVYRMGSLLNAFGIYSYYRNPDADGVQAGSEGFIDESQVMFYKDRYFVRISASGNVNPEQAAFAACAKAIAGKIPGNSSRPKELEILKIPGIVPQTEKYTAQSVMGYAFFRKGMTAEATLDSQPVKVFVVFNESAQASGNTFDSYLKYLKEKGMKPESSKSKKGATIVARDPLYKGVMVRQTGRYLLGVAGLTDPKKGALLIELLQSRIGSALSGK